MPALADFSALRAKGEEDALKKSLSRRSRKQNLKQPTLFKPPCLLISWSWLPLALPKFGGFSFVLSANRVNTKN